LQGLDGDSFKNLAANISVRCTFIPITR